MSRYITWEELKKNMKKTKSPAEKQLSKIKDLFWDIDLYGMVRDGRKLRDNQDRVVLKCKTYTLAVQLMKVFEAIQESVED